MTHILLIVPPGNITQKIFSMNEAGGITGILSPEKIDYTILDCNGSENDLRFIKSLAHCEPVCIAIILQWERDIKINTWLRTLIAHIRRRWPGTHLNCLGRAATIYYRQLLQSGLYDSVIRGETEKTFLALFSRLVNGNQWRATKGIAYNAGNRVMTTSKRVAISDLDNLPPSNRDYLKTRRKYPVAPLYTSRSCQGECAFCFGKLFRQANPCMSVNKRMRSSRSIVDEIEYIVKHHGTKRFYFVDDNFIPNGDIGMTRAEKIARLIVNRGLKIRFSIECRADDVSMEIMQLLKRAGLQKVFVGLESGSDNVLKRYRKGTTVADNLQAVKTLKKAGIGIDPGFIMFDPWTRFEELLESLAFIEHSQIYQCKAQYSLFKTLSILPGSEIEQMYEKREEIHDRRVIDVKRALTYADQLVSRYGLCSSEHGRLSSTSRLFEGKRRNLLYQVFRESIRMPQPRDPTTGALERTGLLAHVELMASPLLEKSIKGA